MHQISYLRGLDGAVPGVSADDRSAAEPGGEDAEGAGGSGYIEWPTGRGRLDYARRLAERLTRLERSFGPDQRLAAIGVVGSDVYDKQVLLQALHDRLPGVIFFTTDLDVQLVHPSQYQWSRNLLIESSFGLELHRRLQGGIPPFRDSYQTATYLAVLRTATRSCYIHRIGELWNSMHAPCGWRCCCCRSASWS